MGTRSTQPPAGGSLKCDLVRERLRKQIMEGRWAPGTRLLPEPELTQRLRTSLTTMRRALNDLAREGLIVRRRGSGSYVTDRRRPPLLPGRTLRLGILSPFPVTERLFQDPLHGRIVRGILSELGLEPEAGRWLKGRPQRASGAEWNAAARGLQVRLLGGPPGTSVRHPSLASVAEGRFDGLIAYSILDAEWLERLLRRKMPTVLADFAEPRFSGQADLVFFDPLDGYRRAVRYFVEQGLRRIHFVGGLYGRLVPERAREAVGSGGAWTPPGYRVDPDTYLRLSAYRQEMDARGRPAPERWIHYERTNTEALARLAERLLARPEAERPEAVVCHGVEQAERLIAFFARRGCALRGAGGATVRPLGAALPVLAPGRELGAASAALLISRLQRPERPTMRVGVAMAFVPPGADFE